MAACLWCTVVSSSFPIWIVELSGLVFQHLTQHTFGKEYRTQSQKSQLWVIIKNRVMVKPGGNPASVVRNPGQGYTRKEFFGKKGGGCYLMVSLQPKTDLSYVQSVIVTGRFWCHIACGFPGSQSSWVCLTTWHQFYRKKRWIWLFILKLGFYHIAQAGLNFASAFWALQFPGMQHHTQSENEYLVLPLPNEPLYWYWEEDMHRRKTVLATANQKQQNATD